MIIDHIRNRALYYGLGEDVKAALDFFAEYHDDNPAEADLPLPGKDIVIRVRPGVTKTDTVFESHDHHMDIHYLAKGVEGIGYANTDTLTVTAHNEKEDYSLLEGKGDLLTLTEGYFMITFPQDAHRPCTAVGEPCAIHKLIAKLKV